MSQARNATVPDERGRYRVWCEPCDASDDFPTIEMAVMARKMHLCEGEVPSYSWPGWVTEGDE